MSDRVMYYFLFLVGGASSILSIFVYFKGLKNNISADREIIFKSSHQDSKIIKSTPYLTLVFVSAISLFTTFFILSRKDIRQNNESELLNLKLTAANNEIDSLQRLLKEDQVILTFVKDSLAQNSNAGQNRKK